MKRKKQNKKMHFLDANNNTEFNNRIQERLTRTFQAWIRLNERIVS